VADEATPQFDRLGPVPTGNALQTRMPVHLQGIGVK
jgi:hypothetical protein